MRGRVPKYTPERVEIMLDAIRRGETYDTSAKLGGIHIATFHQWRIDHPDFDDAVKAAKKEFEDWQMNGILQDATKGLKTLVNGYEFEEVKTEYEPDPKNGSNPRIKKQYRTHKKVGPNATAVIFALTNRAPELWQNRYLQEVNAKVDADARADVNLAQIPDDLLAQVIETLNKQKQ